MELQTLLTSTDGGVATITLNQPESLNAYTSRMGVELFSSLARFDDDKDIRAIVVTGAGRHFCAGAALDGGDTFAGEAWADAEALEERVRPWNMGTPVIAAINGAAVGIGATMLLHWDLRIAASNAKLGFVFTRLGITPEHHSTWYLPRLIGMARATELFLTGRFVLADEALSIGLVNEVAAPDRVLERAQELGREIARRTAPAAVAATKRLLWRQLVDPDPTRAKAREDAVFYWSGKTPDAAEGVNAFLDKRDPVWSMSSADLPPEACEPMPAADS